MPPAVIVKVDSRDPDFFRITEIARESREGRLVAFPTETVYGIGAPMICPKVEERLRKLKSRSKNKPFAYHIGSWEMIDHLGVKRSPEFRFVKRRFLPGPLTVLVMTREGKKIGLRFPRNPTAIALINACGVPFIATSANLSGEKDITRGSEVARQFSEVLDFIIDQGQTEIGGPSTVLDLTGKPPHVIRSGAMSKEVSEAVKQIRSGNYPRRTILVVCTGNSCRSPMAEGFIRDELARQGKASDIEVLSCGVHARHGSEATTEAIYVMRNHEIDISGHRSRICTREDVMDADLIFAMSKEHQLFITGMVPQAKAKTVLLDIKDPIGCPVYVYEDTYKTIEEKIRANWKKIIGK